MSFDVWVTKRTTALNTGVKTLNYPNHLPGLSRTHLTRYFLKCKHQCILTCPLTQFALHEKDWQDTAIFALMFGSALWIFLQRNMPRVPLNPSPPWWDGLGWAVLVFTWLEIAVFSTLQKKKKKRKMRQTLIKIGISERTLVCTV